MCEASVGTGSSISAILMGDGSPDQHMAELYDMQADPAESKNLINDPVTQGDDRGRWSSDSCGQ